MTEKKQLSLCMITNNDEKYLSDCLQELNEIVDEVVIADLGSNDKTIDIAKQAGANVYQIEWNHNFSEIKNFCLDHANGRWILFLQPNEFISEEQRKEIKMLLDNPNAEGYLLYIDYNADERGISSPTQSLRLVRNRKEYRYQYKSFEMIPDELITSIKDSYIQIVHRNNSLLPWDIRLRVSLLQEEIIELPENSYVQYMYGIELLNQHKYEESNVYLEKARSNVNFGYLYAPHLYKCLSWSLLYLEHYTEALDVLNEGINHFSFYTDLLVLRGELRKQLKQYGEAIQDLESCLEIKEQPNYLVPGPEIDVPVILETLGEIHEQLLNDRQALAYYQRAYELNNTNHDLLYKIGELAFQTDSGEVMENLLKTSIEQENLEQFMVLMDILFQQREYTKVLANMEYLESFLGIGDQTESIKLSCLMMLGEMQNDFSAISEQSPFYSQILLQRIEYHWFHNQWSQAEQLLEEVDQSDRIDPSIKALYQLIHGSFSGKELCYKALTQTEYEAVSTLHGNLLWLGQEEKAKILLPLLLKESEDDCYINIAKPWAERNNFQILQQIFLCVSNHEKQSEFKQIIIKQLLRYEHVETAQKLMMLGDSESLQGLECVLWSKEFVKKIDGWIQGMATSTDTTAAIDASILNQPSTVLLDFYFRLTKSSMVEKMPEDSNIELTCAEVHEGIGAFYDKVQKSEEAVSAYLRGLQWDPQNERLQNKIRSFSNKNPSRFHDVLEKKEWVSEGSWFYHKQEFVHYIYGLIAFYNQQFEQAFASFSQIADDEMSYPVAFAYIISGLWLEEKNEEAKNLLNKHRIPAGFNTLLSGSLKNYILCRLNEGHRQYPYSELIQNEKERIREINF